MRVKPSVAFSDAFECPGVGSFNINNVTIESNTAGRKTVCLQSRQCRSHCIIKPSPV